MFKSGPIFLPQNWFRYDAIFIPYAVNVMPYITFFDLSRLLQCDSDIGAYLLLGVGACSMVLLSCFSKTVFFLL